MRNLQQLHNQYEDYQEHMNANGGSTIFIFEEWINYLLSVGELTEEEYKKCYTIDGYLRETKMKVDRD
jgi:hypothetical protein